MEPAMRSEGRVDLKRGVRFQLMRTQMTPAKETALRTLKDAGYEVLDYFYTPRSIEFGSTPGQMLLKLPRKLLFAIGKDFTVRFLGGFSLLVLAR